MKEQTVLQCAKCHEHTPLIETENSEEIAKAIERYKRCQLCGHGIMLCYNSRTVTVGKPKILSWRSQYDAEDSCEE